VTLEKPTRCWRGLRPLPAGKVGSTHRATHNIAVESLLACLDGRPAVLAECREGGPLSVTSRRSEDASPAMLRKAECSSTACDPRARANQMEPPTFRGDPNGRFSENTGGSTTSRGRVFWTPSDQKPSNGASGNRAGESGEHLQDQGRAADVGAPLLCDRNVGEV
jgi:hypothetical protein